MDVAGACAHDLTKEQNGGLPAVAADPGGITARPVGKRCSANNEQPRLESRANGTPAARREPPVLVVGSSGYGISETQQVMAHVSPGTTRE